MINLKLKYCLQLPLRASVIMIDIDIDKLL